MRQAHLKRDLCDNSLNHRVTVQRDSPQFVRKGKQMCLPWLRILFSLCKSNFLLFIKHLKTACHRVIHIVTFPKQTGEKYSDSVLYLVVSVKRYVRVCLCVWSAQIKACQKALRSKPLWTTNLICHWKSHTILSLPS